MIIDHEHHSYVNRWKQSGANRFNGAYYYSKEIVRNIIPNVETDRSWVLVNTYGYCTNHSIVFIHNNKNPVNYQWLSRYKDLILVCGIPETMELVERWGTPIYLPLSIDVEEVSQYRSEKTKEVAFVGRRSKRMNTDLPSGIDYLEDMPRGKLLEEMAKYKKIYAVGRTALEGLCLGCEILPYDPRFPDVDRWKVLDNREAAKILQKELIRIDGL